MLSGLEKDEVKNMLSGQSDIPTNHILVVAAVLGLKKREL